MQLPSALFGLSPQIFSLKNFLFFFLEKLLWKSFLYFLKKVFLIFRKQNFLIFRERYSQNPGTFRTRSISRTRDIFWTLSNIYDGTFCKNIYLVHFSAWAPKKNAPRENVFTPRKENSNSYIKTFPIFSQKRAVFIFQEMETPKKFLFFLKRKLFLYFMNRKPRKKFLLFQETELSYISGNRNPKKLFIFQEVTFRTWKNEKYPLLKSFIYFCKWNFLAPSFKNFSYFRREFEKPGNEFLFTVFERTFQT